MPRLDLAQANALRLTLAEAAFDEVLAGQNKFNLTSTAFRQIARRVLQDAGLTHLLD